MEENRQRASAHGSISLDRFRAILESYGAAPARWPEAERDRALALIAKSEDARKLCDAAGHLDDVLRNLTPPAPSRALRETLRRQPLSGVEHREAAGSGWRHYGWRRSPIWRIRRPAAFAATALVAFAIGFSVPSPWRTGDQSRTDIRPLDPVTIMDEPGGVEVEVLSIVGDWPDDESREQAATVGFAVAEATVSDLNPAPEGVDPMVEIPLY